jgi:PAS domain S-box-containing protein
MNEKVLIVDDEMIINLNLRRVLEKNGYEPLFVHSGEKCLEKLESGYIPDIILMDINLGEDRMSGPDTTDRIYQHYNIPVVLHSAYTDKKTIDQTKEMTKYGYIHKIPGNDHFLLATIEMALKLFRSEQELRRSEQKYRHLFNNASDAIFLYTISDNRCSTFIEVNDVACRQLGYSRVELLELGRCDIMVDTGGYDDSELIRILNENEECTYETVHQTKQGTYVPVEVKSHLSVMEGQPTVLSTVRDITERKRSQQELQKSEERFRQLAENIKETFWLSTPSMDEFYYVSPTFESTWGFPGSVLYDNPRAWLDAIEEDVREEIQRIIEDRKPDEQEPVLFPEFRVRRPDGSIRWVSARGYPVEDRHGNVYRIAGIAEDITNRKRMEEALNNAYTDLDEIFNVSVPLCVISSNYEMLRVNNSFCRCFGQKEENVIGRKCHDVIRNPVCHTEECELYCIAHGKTQASNSFKANSGNGEARDVLVTAVPYRNSQGELIGVVENFTDITDLRRTEREYRELANHLQHVREEQSAYIAREIHDDLGQTLTALKMNLTLLQQDCRNVHRCQENNPVQESITDMQAILDTMVTKIREITRELRPPVLDTSSIIEAIGWQVQEAREYAGFEIDYASNIDTLELDKDTSLAIFRIVQETLTNCIRHSDADRVRINVVSEHGSLIIKVSDNGKGFVPDEPSKKQSFGIISIQQRASACGGRVAIESSPGKGTAVTLTVPLEVNS